MEGECRRPVRAEEGVVAIAAHGYRRDSDRPSARAGDGRDYMPPALSPCPADGSAAYNGQRNR